jgi:hypothetical protein
MFRSKLHELSRPLRQTNLIQNSRVFSTSMPTQYSNWYKFQLREPEEKATELEDQLFAESVEEVDAFFKSPRFQGIKRPYSAEDVATKRGTLFSKEAYPSSVMAAKLFKLLKYKGGAGEPIHTSKPVSLYCYGANLYSGRD